MTVLELQGVRKIYRRGRLEVQALRGIDLTIRRGERLAILGPSGAGKSTLLGIAGLLEAPTSGTVRIEGRDVSMLADDERSRLRGRAIGFVFQSHNLIPQLRAWENVALPLRYASVPAGEGRELALHALEQVRLTARRDHYPNELSGGEEQRVAIARAIVNRPALILADEPTGNLDSATGELVLDMLEAVAGGEGALVLVTHSTQAAARATRIVRLVDGEVTAGTGGSR
jgi:putative ABC transport system ATP-binding protein